MNFQGEYDLKIYGIKNCDSCRKAQKFLLAAGYETSFVDVRKDGVQRADLERFWAEFGDVILNKRSTTWRRLNNAERAALPLNLLVNFPTLMKRPVIDHNGSLTLGWTKDVQAKFMLF